MSNAEEVESQMRQFDMFGRALGQLDSRIADLDELARRLVAEKHMEATAIAELNERVLAAQHRLHERMDAVRRELEAALRVARFDGSVTELQTLVSELLALLNGAPTATDAATLGVDEKLAALKQRQALDIQLTANAPRIRAVEEQLATQSPEAPIRQSRPPTAATPTLSALPSDVVARARHLLADWSELQARARALDAALQEARQLFTFGEAVDRVLAWIRDRQLMLAADDVGRDYEHCEELIERLIGRHADASVDEETLAHVNRLGRELMGHGGETRGDVERRLDEMNEA